MSRRTRGPCPRPRATVRPYVPARQPTTNQRPEETRRRASKPRSHLARRNIDHLPRPRQGICPLSVNMDRGVRGRYLRDLSCEMTVIVLQPSHGICRDRYAQYSSSHRDRQRRSSGREGQRRGRSAGMGRYSTTLVASPTETGSSPSPPDQACPRARRAGHLSAAAPVPRFVRRRSRWLVDDEDAGQDHPPPPRSFDTRRGNQAKPCLRLDPRHVGASFVRVGKGPGVRPPSRRRDRPVIDDCAAAHHDQFLGEVGDRAGMDGDHFEHSPIRTSLPAGQAGASRAPR